MRKNRANRRGVASVTHTWNSKGNTPSAGTVTSDGIAPTPVNRLKTKVNHDKSKEVNMETKKTLFMTDQHKMKGANTSLPVLVSSRHPDKERRETR